MIYPHNFEQKIGFNDIRKQLKGRCLSSLGTEEVDRLAFQSNCETISKQLSQIHEFRVILNSDDDFPTENFLDMRPALVRTQARGSYMDETDLFALKSSLVTISSIVVYLQQTQETGNEETGKAKFPTLKELTADVASFPQIVESIDEILNKYGHVKDTASPDLKRIRSEIATTKKSISINLYSILRKAQQEGFVEKDVTPTFRDGRLVIPIAPGMKRKIRGIVHDESASGKTVFIEPAEVVEANNRIRELEIEEKRAIIAILIKTTDYIRPHIEELLQSYKFLGHVDLIRAKAVLAESMEAIEPTIENRPMMDWKGAIHPILQTSLKHHGKKMIPLDIRLTDSDRIILISGPNAGGKSVCLKTAGLLQYMLQCGLSVPIKESSTMGLFKNLFIDIGDEQSLEDDLSTYSSHLLNMKNMMKQADEQSLILIDEFGGGTEPQIGAAIAQAVLGRFVGKHIYGIITTHYQNLKYFADNHTGIVNGAMLYDRQLMQPLFQLQIGHAGSSFAIEIARKIGFPEEVIKEAAETVGSDYIQSDKYVQDIMRDKRYWENKRSSIHEREKHLDEIIKRYENGIRELEQNRKKVLYDAKEQAESLLKESNAQIENTIRSIKEAQAEKEQTKQLRQSLDEFKKTVVQAYDETKEDKIARKIQQIKERRLRQDKRKRDKSTPTNTTNEVQDKKQSPLKEGMFVKIQGQSGIGQIIKLNDKTAILTTGTIQMNIATSRLIPTEMPKQHNSSQAFSFISKETRDEIYEKKLNFRPEIDVRGMNGEEALHAVTYFVDDAILLGVARLRILHGTGSGYLRQVIRQYLHSVPNVSDCRDEHVQFGGAGITIVDLK